MIPYNRHPKFALGTSRRRHGFQCNRNRNTSSSRCRNADRIRDLAIREFIDDSKLLSVPQPLIRHYPCRHGFVVPKLLVPPHKRILFAPKYPIHTSSEYLTLHSAVPSVQFLDGNAPVFSLARNRSYARWRSVPHRK